MTIKPAIEAMFLEVLSADGKSLNSAGLTDDTVLLESGLDSLGFAVLVARLEEDLGYDPFTIADEAIYPRTFAEFVSVYERFKPTTT